MLPGNSSAILNNSTSIAIVGVSDKPERASYLVAKYLIEQSNYTIFLVNPLLTDLFGKPVYSSLGEIPARVDIVDIFRRVEEMPELLDQAIAIGAKVFWMQLGLRDPATAKVGEAAGLHVVQDLCIKVEHEKL